MIDRAIRRGRHRNFTGKKTGSGIPKTFKGSLPEVGEVLGSKEENFKERFQILQEIILQYMVENNKKGVYLALLTRKVEYIDISIK